MSDIQHVYHGGCFCGSVRYSAMTKPLNQLVCHCRRCQQAVGAAFNARLLFRQDDVSIRGNVSAFATGDLSRTFCPACGSSLSASLPSHGYVGLTAGTLDDPSLFKPQAHIWTSSKQSWVTFDDGLPQFLEMPPKGWRPPRS